MFIPKKIKVRSVVDDENEPNRDRVLPRGARKATDCNMFWLAIVFILFSFGVTSSLFNLEYTSAQFGWQSEQLGNYLSITGIARTFLFMAILPLVTKFFNRPSSSSDSSTSTLRFDLGVLRSSLAVKIIGFIAMVVARKPALFTLASIMECFGSGIAPAMSSVALELYRRTGETETGKLFGALSVLQVIGAQAIGPALFGFLYSSTVSIFPQSIFVLSAAALGLATLVTFLVRIRGSPVELEDDEDDCSI